VNFPGPRALVNVSGTAISGSFGSVLNNALLGLRIFCDHSAVAMRIGAGLASAKLTLLPRSSTTSRTRDSECLFWTEFFFHAGEMMPQN
jgi:hypothetical protein